MEETEYESDGNHTGANGGHEAPGQAPGADFGGPLVEHVRRRVEMSEALDEVIVATCDEEIREVVEAAGS